MDEARAGAAIAGRGRWRPGRNFLLGMLVGGIGAALFWHFYPGFWQHPPAAALDAAMQRRQAWLAQAQRERAVAATPPAPAAPGVCAFEPILPAAGASDGTLRIEHPFPAGPRAKAKVFLRKADTAAAAGRARDEEVALIAACRYSAEASARPTVPLARVLATLGERYAAAAALQSVPDVRAELLQRAYDLLARSADAFGQALGPNAARSRAARERVAALEEGRLVVADASAPQAVPGAAPRSRPKEQQARSDAVPSRGKEQQAPARPTPRAAPPEPRRIAPDPELRQLATDLARLRAQAEAVSDDPAGFRRRAERAQARRDACADAACLRAWHAQRRAELLGEF